MKKWSELEADDSGLRRMEFMSVDSTLNEHCDIVGLDEEKFSKLKPTREYTRAIQSRKMPLLPSTECIAILDPRVLELQNPTCLIFALIKPLPSTKKKERTYHLPLPPRSQPKIPRPHIAGDNPPNKRNNIKKRNSLLRNKPLISLHPT